MAEMPKNSRALCDFTNADGKTPTGKNTTTDDTVAMQKALAVGPGIVYIDAGYYRVGEVSIPAGVAVIGAGASTVIRSNGAKDIFNQQGSHDWAIHNLTLDGEAAGKWEERKDMGFTGIAIEHCWGYELTGVVLRNFNGTGLHITHTDLPGAGWCNGGNLDRVTASGNYIGIHFDLRAEYINATELNCSYNITGCLIHAGNAKVVASNFSLNTDGLVIEDKENGSHGIIANCMLNHNNRYALLAKGALNGMNITGCCFFYGTLQLENSVGINVSGGSISCFVTTIGTKANRIAGNYIIPETFTFTLAPSTIVEGNFTEKGLWEKNGPQ